MTFTARLVRGSPIWRLWTDHHRTGGLVAGTRFHWVAGGDFATGELMPHQVGPLLGLADVRVEMITNAPLPVSTMELLEQPISQPAAVPAQQPVQQTTAPIPPSPERSTLRLPDHQQYRSKGHRR